MKQVPFFKWKAVCITLGAMAGTVAVTTLFPALVRAIATVIAAGAGALLSYLLNPNQQPPPPLQKLGALVIDKDKTK
jgi:hypothetical protein